MPERAHDDVTTTDPGPGRAPAGPAVEVDDLVVTLGGTRILHGLTFAAPAGRVTGLLGPSGCGKTTLMRCVVGVQRITGGAVRVLGRPAGEPPLRHRVGYVTQAASVYTDLSVRDNVRYFAAVYGVPASAADRALADVALADRAGQRVGTLSGGQRTRVSLACALLAAPEVLVLDEPTVGLDPVLRRELWARFHELTAAGATLLVSSHVMDEAGQCDRLLLMREGRLIADDSPAALRAATGTEDLEEAFLRLLRDAESADAAGPVAGATGPVAAAAAGPAAGDRRPAGAAGVAR
jgi:ABC-2 type transport system ATP-binding protein